jgi:glycosyltransferase involved in cell wall biosynthesis
MTAVMISNPASTPRAMPSQRTRRLLLIAYCFPPVGGAGVQRPVKWVKYLQRRGWETTVLTPENPSVPVLDHSLLDEIPESTRFVKPRTWEPSYATKQGLGGSSKAAQTLWTRAKRTVRGWVRQAATLALQPDPQILWYPNALSAARRCLQETPHDAILCTAPPYSSFLLGAALRRRFGLPLILDFRDEWDLSSAYLENALRDRYSRFVQQRMQNRVLQQADAVIATTQASQRHLADRLTALRHPITTACIYNGYDAEDFSVPRISNPAVPPVAAGKFRVVYTGTLWNLTTIAPLIEAVEQLHQHQPDLLQRLELVCIGRKTPEQQALLDRLSTTRCSVDSIGYSDHDTVLAWMQSADALCLLLSHVPGAERVVPAKLFEYLAARRTILSIVPDGEAANLLQPFHPQSRFHPTDVNAIAQWLQQRLQSAHSGQLSLDLPGLCEFSRERQTDRLVQLLNDLTGVTVPFSRLSTSPSA